MKPFVIWAIPERIRKETVVHITIVVPSTVVGLLEVVAGAWFVSFAINHLVRLIGGSDGTLGDCLWVEDGMETFVETRSYLGMDSYRPAMRLFNWGGFLFWIFLVYGLIRGPKFEKYS